MDTTKYFGIYRAIVIEGSDPMGLGRIAIRCPAVGETTSLFALICLPIGADSSEPIKSLPTDTNVWVQFEAGDPDRPVLVGATRR